MDERAAQLILYAITGIEIVVWLAGLWFLLTSCPARKPPPGERFDFTEPPPRNLIRGFAEVEGDPAPSAAKAAALLAKGDVGPFGQLKIVHRSSDLVAFEGTGSTSGSQLRGRYVRRGQLQFTPAAGNRTRIDYEVEASGGIGLLWGGAIFQCLGLVALAAGFWLMQTYVVSSPDPAVRGQTFQMLQAGHFLWPPFLFVGIYRKGYSVVRAGFDTLVHNLPYYSD